MKVKSTVASGAALALQAMGAAGTAAQAGSIRDDHSDADHNGQSGAGAGDHGAEHGQVNGLPGGRLHDHLKGEQVRHDGLLGPGGHFHLHLPFGTAELQLDGFHLSIGVLHGHPDPSHRPVLTVRVDGTGPAAGHFHLHLAGEHGQPNPPMAASETPAMEARGEHHGQNGSHSSVSAAANGTHKNGVHTPDASHRSQGQDAVGD